MKIIKKAQAGLIAIVALSFGAVSTAQAAIPTEASDAVTALVTDAGAFVLSFWPVVIAVTMAFALMRLFKRGTSSAV